MEKVKIAMANRSSPKQVSYAPFFVGVYMTLFIGGLLYFSSVTKSEHARNASLFVAGILLLPAVSAFQIQMGGGSESTSSALDDYLRERLRTPPKEPSTKKTKSYSEAVFDQLKTQEQIDRYVVERILKRLGEIVRQPTIKEGIAPRSLEKEEVKILTTNFEVLKSVTKKLSLSALDYLKLGNAYFEEDKFEKALASYNKAIEINPVLDEAWFGYGVVLYELERFKEARTSFERAIESNPDFYEAWINHGNTQGQLGCYEEAFNSYERAIKIKPRSYEAYFNYGKALEESNHFNKAITQYDNAISIKPERFEAWLQRGINQSKLNLYDESIVSFDKVIAIHPSYAGSYLCKACVYALQGNTDLAIADLKKAIELDPKYLEMAKNDPDFDNIRNDDRFKQLIQTCEEKQQQEPQTD
ncbi:tetratricopeptide repeat protein [Thalassoporum mexicanum]|uniref:tetratricopeptide repeat protein n=2 Tax=Thalassoporum mexicanum TaxID=3457544 RepID=UPI0018DE1D22|nr:tetratricopeptide repeat protein [Pseudanabaena sp. PCC 7367]